MCNAEKTIRSALDSVLRQTIENIEIIVINDGSTDRTLEQLQPLDDPRIEICSQPNRGVGAARNRGLEKATGKHIAFLDADDYWAPEKLACQLKSLAHHPEADVVYSQVKAVDRQGRFLFCYPLFMADGNVSDPIMERCFIVSGSNILIKRDCVKHTGFFNPGLSCFGDWEYAIRLARRHRFVAVPDYHIYYRYGNRSLSTNVRQMEKDGLKVISAQIARPFPDHMNFARSFVYRHLVFVALFRRTGPGKGGLALRYLVKSARHCPVSVLSIEYLRLLAACVLLTHVPGNTADRFSRWLLETYGRWHKKHTRP